MKNFRRRLIAAGISVGLAGMALPSTGLATVITFNQSNALASQFSQEPLPGAFYTETQTGGTFGGTVNGYSGSDYFATAVLKSRTFSFGLNNSISLGIDFYFSGKLTPLVPGLNAVRSLRLGLLGSKSAAFEMYGDQSVYVEGLYAIPLNQMYFAAIDQTQSVIIAGSIGAFTPVTDSWYELDATFQNQGNGMKTFEGTVLSLGSEGRSPPVSVVSWKQTIGIPSPSGLSGPVYAGFSALAGGGISSVDNLSVPGGTQDVPEPSSLGLLAIALGFLGALRSKSRRPFGFWRSRIEHRDGLRPHVLI